VGTSRHQAMKVTALETVTMFPRPGAAQTAGETALRKNAAAARGRLFRAAGLPTAQWSRGGPRLHGGGRAEAVFARRATSEWTEAEPTEPECDSSDRNRRGNWR
jgi:hypothetical protein